MLSFVDLADKIGYARHSVPRSDPAASAAIRRQASHIRGPYREQEYGIRFFPRVSSPPCTPGQRSRRILYAIRTPFRLMPTRPCDRTPPPPGSVRLKETCIGGGVKIGAVPLSRSAESLQKNFFTCKNSQVFHKRALTNSRKRITIEYGKKYR